MLPRFSLAILFAVLVAAARPLPRGGAHDLLAVGVRVERSLDGGTVERLVLATPAEDSIRAYDALLRTPARQALLQGTTVHTAPGEGPPPEGVRIRELVYYGHRTRAGRAPVAFTGDAAGAAAGSAEAWEVARGLASLPDTVTAAAARVLLRSPDDAAFRDALEALAGVRADLASTEALAVALAPSGEGATSTVRRVVAVRALKSLGGAAVYPEAFRRLAEDPDALVREAAR